MDKIEKKKTIKNIALIGLSFLVTTLFVLLPAPQGLTQSAWSVLGIFAGGLILWLGVGIDWPSLLVILLLGFIPEIGFKNVLLNTFGNETFLFLLFTFLMTYALSTTPLLKRIAIWFMSTKLAKKGGWWFVISYFVAVMVLGLFISPTVLFVIMLPLLEEIFALAGLQKGEKIASVLMMGLGFTVSISSGMTPISHVFSVMAMNFYKTATGLTISYPAYMAFAIPLGILLMVAMILVFRFVYKPDVSKLKNIDVSPLKAQLPKMNAQEWVSLSVFAFVILLWIVPSLLKDWLPTVYTFINGFGTAMPPLLGVVILSLIHFKQKPLLSLKEGLSKGVPWASLLMCAGTLGIAYALALPSIIGITAFLTTGLQGVATLAPILVVLLFMAWAALQTNLSSNMVTVTVVTTASLPILLAMGSSISAAAVVGLIGFMGSMAFATPPSMPHIALISSGGWCKSSHVLSYGFLLMGISIILATFVGYYLALWVL